MVAVVKYRYLVIVQTERMETIFEFSLKLVLNYTKLALAYQITTISDLIF